MKQDIKQAIKTRYTASEIEKAKGHIYTVEKSDDNQFSAVVPAPMVEEFNYHFASESEAWAWLVTAREMHPDGKNWEIDPAKKTECAHHLLSLLRDVCVNDDDEIEQPFLHFDELTDRTDIWHWIEVEFDVSIAALEGIA